MLEKRKNLISKMQELHFALGKIDSVLEHIELLCDKCKIKEECSFVYHDCCVRFKNISLKPGQEESDFSKFECMFFVKNPKFEYLKYTGKKKVA